MTKISLTALFFSTLILSSAQAADLKNLKDCQNINLQIYTFGGEGRMDTDKEKLDSGFDFFKTADKEISSDLGKIDVKVIDIKKVARMQKEIHPYIPAPLIMYGININKTTNQAKVCALAVKAYMQNVFLKEYHNIVVKDIQVSPKFYKPTDPGMEFKDNLQERTVMLYWPRATIAEKIEIGEKSTGEYADAMRQMNLYILQNKREGKSVEAVAPASVKPVKKAVAK